MQCNVNKKNIVIFNSPPGTGKDIAAKHCAEEFYGKHLEFKRKLFEIAILVSRMSEEAWWRIYNADRDSYKNKETPLDCLEGLSQRKFLIKISEEWIKPTFGRSYFGECLLETILSTNKSCYFISDSGFMEEVLPLIEEPGLRLMLIHISKDGHSFEKYGDSRAYLPRYLFDYYASIDNNGTKKDFLDNVTKHVRQFLAPF